MWLRRMSWLSDNDKRERIGCVIMLFQGKCKEIDRLLVADMGLNNVDLFGYERTNLGAKDWFATGYVDRFHDLSSNDEGVSSFLEFVVGLYAPKVNFDLNLDGTFVVPKGVDVKKHSISVGTGSVALGVNGGADDIKNCHCFGELDCSLNNLKQGDFGYALEGCKRGQVQFLMIYGYVRAKAGYSEDEILDYLLDSLQIDSVKVQSLEAVLLDAKARSECFGTGKGQRIGNVRRCVEYLPEN